MPVCQIKDLNLEEMSTKKLFLANGISFGEEECQSILKNKNEYSYDTGKIKQVINT